MLFFETMLKFPLLSLLVLTSSVTTDAIETFLTTRLGHIRGTEEKYGNTSLHTYLNIPYAQPPVGSLRFQKPQPLNKWSTILDGTSFGPSCPQTFRLVVTEILTNNNQSEDCLQLNIYVPGGVNNAHKKSVMVWIHGGAYELGQAQLYDAAPLAVEGDVIVVTINYRLGVFGFLVWNEATPTGNYGLWDQLMALQWVHDNIDSFGGDPGSVTIFGESAGGFSVSILSILPMAKGLFQRVIAQSGVANSFLALNPNNRKKQTSEGVMELLGCNRGLAADKLQCLQSKSVPELLSAQVNPSVYKYFVNDQLTFSLNYAPHVDKELIPAQPYDLLSDPHSDSYRLFTSLDFMAGTTSNEGSLFRDLYLPPIGEKFSFNTSHGLPEQIYFDVIVPTLVREVLGNGTPENIVGEVKKFYQGANIEDQALLVTHMFNDAFFLVPTLQLLDLHSSSQTGHAHTYEYVFDLPGLFENPHSWFQGSPHGNDVYYLFNITKFAAIVNHTVTSEELNVSLSFQAMWANFAKTGNPNVPSVVSWPEYDVTDQSFMHLSTNITVETHVHPQRTQFWLNLLSHHTSSSPGAIG